MTSARTAVVLALCVAVPHVSVAAGSGDVRLHFEATMAALTSDLAGLVVTSKHRTEADQLRLAEAGYRPHPRSQHKQGLAWDCAGSADALETLRERARAAGFVALEMESPVTGATYVHVQRYARSPALDLDAPPMLLAARAALPADPVVAVPTLLTAIEPPRLLDVRGLDLPRRLLRKRVEGRIVLLLEVSEQGYVLDVEIDESDLPAFETFVSNEVKRWRFAPARVGGLPANVYARLPIPIRIQ